MLNEILQLEWISFSGTDIQSGLEIWNILILRYRYNSAFGSPVGRVQGIGYVSELLARLTHTPIATHNSSTNSTLDDNPITFPLGQSLYVDATHEVVVLNSMSFHSLSRTSCTRTCMTCNAVITALNLTNFAATGPLPWDHIPPNRSFKTSELSPFATNVQFQRKSRSFHIVPYLYCAHSRVRS